MLLAPQFFRHIFVLTRDELVDLFGRPRSLLTLVLYLGTFIVLAKVVIYFEGSVADYFGGEAYLQQQIDQLIYTLDRPETPSIVRQLLDWPVTLCAFQLICVLWFPALIALVSSDMVSTDIYRGTLRFVMLRTTRSAYYISKLCAHVLLYLAIQTLTMGLVLILCAYKMYDFSFARYVVPGAIYLGLFVPYLWCVVAATQMVSSWSKKPFSALLKVHLLWTALLLVMLISPTASPLYWRYLLGLVAPFDGYGILSALSLSLWALGFTVIGLLGFSRREV